MINPMLFKYTVVVVTEDGSQHDITDHVTELSWDEEENQLPVRISVTARNSKTPIGYISDFATPGCWIKKCQRGEFVLKSLQSFFSRSDYINLLNFFQF